MKDAKVYMRAAWLPVNQRWIVLFGDSHITIGSGPYFYETKKELRSDLKRVGLKLGRNNSITMIA